MSKQRSPISSKKVHEVFMKTKGTCFYCGVELPEDTIHLDWGGKEVSRRRNWHIDHVFPVSKGGTDNIENLVPSCITCNADKGAR